MTINEQAPGTALILGASGSIGAAVAFALAARGWRIRALTRRGAASRPQFPFAIDWREGDALDDEAVTAAAAGADVILHGVNPPGYRRWREDGLPMLANTLAAAKASGATVLFPANVYVFSPASPRIVAETAVRKPTTHKGQVRLEMEAMLESAAQTGGVRVIAVRAGDFFGPGVVGSWFAQAVAKGGVATKAAQVLSPAGTGHAWAYVPDLAETFARLVDRRSDLPAFTLVHFAGHYDATGRAMAEAVRRAAGRPNLPIRRFPWPIVWLGAPFSPFLREAIEMTWLWTSSLALDNGRLRGLIGEEPHTPLDEAVKAAIGA